MRVQLAETARRDLAAIQEYPINKYPEYLGRTLRGVSDTFHLLARFPEIGRAGLRGGTRELGVTNLPYVIVYALRGNLVQVQNIRHAAMRWPPASDDE